MKPVSPAGHFFPRIEPFPECTYSTHDMTFTVYPPPCSDINQRIYNSRVSIPSAKYFDLHRTLQPIDPKPHIFQR